MKKSMEDEKITVFEGRIMIGPGEPPSDLEPPIIGFLWIDYTKPTIYSCVDATKGSVKWCHLDQAEIAALNNRISQTQDLLNSNIATLNKYMREYGDA